jgi:hypothetical protein
VILVRVPFFFFFLIIFLTSDIGDREVLLFGRGRNKGVFATNQESDTSAYHLNLTFMKNIQLHLIIPNLIKKYIFSKQN